MRSRINATNGVVDFIRSEPMGGMACIRGWFERCGQGCYMDAYIGNFLLLLFILHFVPPFLALITQKAATNKNGGKISVAQKHAMDARYQRSEELRSSQSGAKAR